jgi:mevalonate kinase
MIRRKAPTKVILCGEHFVVYGAPAIAFPTNLPNEVKLSEEKGEGFEIISKERRAWAGADGKVEGDPMLSNYLPLFWSLVGKMKKGRKLKAKFVNRGAITGRGNSASFATALARCLLKYSKRKMTDDELFNLVQETEMRMHGGRASGIDARTVIVGRPQIFMKRFNPLRHNFTDAEVCLPAGTVLIVVDTYKGSRETTAETTARFAKHHGILKKPHELTDDERRKLVEKYGKIFKRMLEELKAEGDAKKLLYLRERWARTAQSSPAAGAKAAQL